MAKKLTTEVDLAYVQGFISRPVLQYHVRKDHHSFAEGTGRSYCYVDAIAKFGSKLTHRDLTQAYVRAGNTFSGSMSQYFVVLSDRLTTTVRTGANRAPLGRRGGRSGPSRFAPSASTSRPGATHPPFEAERGQKRTIASGSETPSKKKENESAITE